MTTVRWADRHRDHDVTVPGPDEAARRVQELLADPDVRWITVIHEEQR
jgi:hypothetical protein